MLEQKLIPDKGSSKINQHAEIKCQFWSVDVLSTAICLTLLGL